MAKKQAFEQAEVIDNSPQLLNYDQFSALLDESIRREAERAEEERLQQLARDRQEFKGLLWQFVRGGLTEVDAVRLQSLAGRVAVQPLEIGGLVAAAKEVDRLTELQQQHEQRGREFTAVRDEKKRLEAALQEAERVYRNAHAMLNLSARAGLERNQVAHSFEHWIFVEDLENG